MNDKIIEAVDRFCDILFETLDSGKGKFKDLRIEQAHELINLAVFIGDYAANMSMPGWKKRNRNQIIKKYQNLETPLKNLLPKTVYNYIQSL